MTQEYPDVCCSVSFVVSKKIAGDCANLCYTACQVEQICPGGLYLTQVRIKDKDKQSIIRTKRVVGAPLFSNS